MTFQPSTSPSSLSVYILEKKNSGDCIILFKVTVFSYTGQHVKILEIETLPEYV